MSLYYSLFSFDSYKRGDRLDDLPYERGVKFNGAEIIYYRTASDEFYPNSGFSAVAYQTDTQIIIAYRGTDEAVDKQVGWPGGAGAYFSPQFQAANEFYEQVVSSGLAIGKEIVFTGHSLGGGLAGLMSGITGHAAYVYDNMTFELSAQILYLLARIAEDNPDYRDNRPSLNDVFGAVGSEISGYGLRLQEQADGSVRIVVPADLFNRVDNVLAAFQIPDGLANTSIFGSLIDIVPEDREAIVFLKAMQLLGLDLSLEAYNGVQYLTVETEEYAEFFVNDSALSLASSYFEGRTISVDPDFSNVNRYAVEGEILGILRYFFDADDQTAYSSPFFGGDPFGLNTKGKKDLTDKHTAGLMVASLYNETLSPAQRQEISVIGDAIYKELFSGVAAITLGDTTDGAAARLLTKIAYTAVSDTDAPYGTSAIKVLFGDAADAGRAFKDYNPAWWSAFEEARIMGDLAKSIVLFSGGLAKSKSTDEQLAEGFIRANTDGLVSLDYSDALWSAAGVDASNILGKDDTIGLLGYDSYFSLTDLANRSWLDANAEFNEENLIGRVHVVVADQGGVNVDLGLIDRAYQPNGSAIASDGALDILATTDNDDRVVSSARNELIDLKDGNDTLVVYGDSKGRDLYRGGSDYDTVVLRYNYDEYQKVFANIASLQKDVALNHSSDGSNTFIGFERFEFADAIYELRDPVFGIEELVWLEDKDVDNSPDDSDSQNSDTGSDDSGGGGADNSGGGGTGSGEQTGTGDDQSGGGSNDGGSGGSSGGSGSGGEPTVVPQGNKNYSLFAASEDATLEYGDSIALSSLYPSSRFIDLDNDGNSIEYFAVQDRTIGGGYLTKNNEIIASGEIFEDALSNIDQYRFVAALSDAEDEIGFTIIDSVGDFSPRLSSAAAAKVTSVETIAAGDSGNGGDSGGDQGGDSGNSGGGGNSGSSGSGSGSSDGGKNGVVVRITGVDSTNPTPGGTASVEISVENTASSTRLVGTLGVYFSEDERPSRRELVGTYSPGTVAPGDVEDRRVSFIIPDDASGNAKIIVVDEDDLNESEQAAIADFNVSTPSRLANLQIGQHYMTDNTLLHGQRVEVEWDVRNTGTADAVRSDVSLYLSKGKTFEEDRDIFLTNEFFGSNRNGIQRGIEAGDNDRQSEFVTITAEMVEQIDGDLISDEFYLLYVIDEDRRVAESTRSDNVAFSRFSIAATEEDLAGYTDHVVTNFTISTDQINFGERFSYSATIENDGRIDVTYGETLANIIWRSVADGSEQKFGALFTDTTRQYERNVPQFSSVDYIFSEGRLAPGYYDVFARVRTDNVERSDLLENNDSNAIRVSVGNPEDLVLATALPALRDIVVQQAGDQTALAVSFTAFNEGYGAYQDPLFVSVVAIPKAGGNEVELGQLIVPGLSANGDPNSGDTFAVDQADISLPAGLEAGSYDVALFLDKASGNNERTIVQDALMVVADESDQIDGGSGPDDDLPNQPQIDFSVYKFGWQRPSNIEIGDSVTVSWGVLNRGPDASDIPLQSGIYASTDENVTTSDILLYEVTVDAGMVAGSSQEFSTSVEIDERFVVGEYWVKALADTGEAFLETDETNNQSSGTFNFVVEASVAADLPEDEEAVVGGAAADNFNYASDTSDKTVSGHGGNDVIATGSGNDAVNGGSGNDDLSSGPGDDVIIDPFGDDDLDGGAGTDHLVSFTGENEFHAGDDGDLVVGGIGSDELYGESGNDVIIGDISTFLFGRDMLDGGTGDDLLSGGGGADEFQFRPNDGSDVIGTLAVDYDNLTATTVTGPDFQIGLDTVKLVGFGYSSGAQALAQVSDVGGHATFDDQGTEITFYGISTSALSADHFVFG